MSCWGQNTTNALGDRAPGAVLGAPAVVQGVSSAVDVTAGDAATCVRFGDGTAKCWGANYYGQLGDGSPNPAGELQPVPMLTGSTSAITAVSNNGLHSCALLADTSAVCWGYFLRGNLGVAIPNHTSTPVVFGSGDLRP